MSKIPYADLSLADAGERGRGDAASANQAMMFVNALDSPWFQVYPDIGKLAEMRFAGPVLL